MSTEIFQNGQEKNPEYLVERLKDLMEELTISRPEMTGDEIQFHTREALWIALKDAGYEVEL